MQSDENTQVGSLVSQINGITGQIATLNQQITEVQALGQAPNDLEDSRDKLLSQLSDIVGVQYSVSSSGAMNISLTGGGALVQGYVVVQPGDYAVHDQCPVLRRHLRRLDYTC